MAAAPLGTADQDCQRDPTRNHRGKVVLGVVIPHVVSANDLMQYMHCKTDGLQVYFVVISLLCVDV